MKGRYGLLLLVMLFGVLSACQTPGPSLDFSPRELPDAQVGQSYEVIITVSRSETPVSRISVDSAELPPGLTLLHEEGVSTAVVRGVPERAGEYEFTVHANCYSTNVVGQAGEQRYTLLVKQE
jgi:hypothetical protein